MATPRTHRPPEIDTATIRRIAVAASADPRTVLRRIAGEPVRGLPGHRIDRVLRAHGIEPGMFSGRVAS
jgi:hypothetical protein